MKIKLKSIIKGAVTFIGSFGVGTVVTLGLKQNIIPKNTYEKIMLALGSFVVTDMISTAAESYLEKQVDEMFDSVEKLKGEPFKKVPHIDFSKDEDFVEIQEMAEEIEEKED